jgi:hypothetical protein
MLFAASTDDQQNFSRASGESYALEGAILQITGSVNTTNEPPGREALTLLIAKCINGAVHFNDEIHLEHGRTTMLHFPIRIPESLSGCLSPEATTPLER